MTFLHSQRFRVTLFFVIFILLLSTPKGYSSEKYYIDDSPVLLYKVINWWYHCLPEEAEFLCGKSVKWSNRGDEKISYNKEKRVLELNVTGGYASMLSAVAPCNQCDQSRYFQCTWLNPEFFDGMSASIVFKDGAITGLQFSNADEKKARTLKRLQGSMQFTLEGKIGGLSNEAICLYRSNRSLKDCGTPLSGEDARMPIVLKITHTTSNNILAVFDNLKPH